jgi:hypothetical protein
MTACKHFSPLDGIIFHKKPQKPTFPHTAHYKSERLKVKRTGAKTWVISLEKSGKIGEQDGKTQKHKLTKTNIDNQNKAIARKPNVKH